MYLREQYDEDRFLALRGDYALKAGFRYSKGYSIVQK